MAHTLAPHTAQPGTPQRWGNPICTGLWDDYLAFRASCAPFTTPAQWKLVQRALRFSANAHQDAVRRSGEPYIIHPVGVTRLLIEEMGIQDVTAIVAALLHDVVEDTFAEEEEINRAFGPVTARIVAGLTKLSALDVGDPSVRQVENYRKILLTMASDIRVALIKLADRLHNLRTLDALREDKRYRIAAETELIYAPLARRLGVYSILGEMEDICMQYTDPTTYQSIRAQLDATLEERVAFIEQVKAELERLLAALRIPGRIEGRVKSIRSIANKMQKQKVDLGQVYDLVALRLILDDVPKDEEQRICYEVYRNLHARYVSVTDRVRDWLANPHPNGYQAVHTTLRHPKGHYFEVQIRTERMHIQAERGVAAHWRYKEHGRPKGSPAPDHTNHLGEPDAAESANPRDFDEQMAYWIEQSRERLENNALDVFDTATEIRNILSEYPIRVFTPKGEVITLPSGATLLDFAYAIHTDVGDHAISGKINNQLAALGQSLNMGDRVEVIVAKNEQVQPDWLGIVKTSKAKNRIRSRTKLQREAMEQKGRELVEHRLAKWNLFWTREMEDVLLRHFRVPDVRTFYYNLGARHITLEEIQNFLRQYQELFRAASTYQLTGPNADALVLRKDDSAVFQYRMAPCCEPVMGQPIVAFIEGDTGSVIHAVNCPVARELLMTQAHNLVKVRWNNEQDVEYLVQYQVKGQDRRRMLYDLVKLLSLRLKLNIRSVTIEQQEGAQFEGTFAVYVPNAEKMRQLEALLWEVEGVNAVDRVFRIAGSR